MTITWIDDEGHNYSILDMTDDHLRGAIAMLRRQGYVTFDELHSNKITGKISNQLAVMEKELRKRG